MVDTSEIELGVYQMLSVFNEEDQAKLRKRNRQMIKGKLLMVKLDDGEMEIDFMGFHTSLVNTYRRIILANVPTMAIEKVFMYNNTSIIQDEVLAHRLGLIPLNANPRLFQFPGKDYNEWNSQDSIKYELKIKCFKEKNVDQQTDIDLMYKNRKVLSSHMKLVPYDKSECNITSGTFDPIHDDILLAKLNPGHEIDLEAVAVKGIGSDHAKFQPGIAWYRLLPEIKLLREVQGSEAALLQKCFTPGVIDLVTNSEGKIVAQVNDARNDSCSRNVLQYDTLKDCVKLTRKTDHIIFYVESQSFYKSYEILEEAVSFMSDKCDDMLNHLGIVENGVHAENENIDQE